MLAIAATVLWLRRAFPGVGRREACLTVAIGAGAYIALSTELLSLLRILSPGWIVTTWALPLVLVAATHRIGVWRRSDVCADTTGSPGALAQRPPLAGLQALKDPVVACSALVVVVTAIVALIAVPNTWDSMTYHMSRVAHCISNESVRFYPCHITRQLYMAPGAEYVVAHLQILAGSDRFANLVQYLSMLGSVCAVTLIARDMGASVRGQRVAALIALTLPMGVLQAATSQNDHVAGLWILAFVLFGRRWSSDDRLPDLIRAATALALAVLTKSTALIIAAPFGAWFAAASIVRYRWRAWRPALLVMATVAAINAGHTVRNTALYGHPLGPLESAGRSYLNDHFSVGALASNSARNLALQLATPFEPINRRVEDVVRLVHSAIGLDVDDPELTWLGLRFHVPPSRCQEDMQGAPLHVFLFAGIFAIALARRRFRARLGPVGAHVLATFLAAVLFALLLRWQPWHTRLHLPIMLLAAPAAAALLTRAVARPMVVVTTLLLTLASAPCLLQAHSRPLIGPNSVLTTPRHEQYFRNNPGLSEPYRDLAAGIRRAGVTRVGFICNADDWEYPLWVLSGRATSFVHVDVRNTSGVLADPDTDQTLQLVVCTYAKRCADFAAREGWSVDLETSTGTLLSRE
jgi:hypothetical protein